MDCRSLARNIGLMCAAKLTGSPGPGRGDRLRRPGVRARSAGAGLGPAAAAAAVSGGQAGVQSQLGTVPSGAAPAPRASAPGASQAKKRGQGGAELGVGGQPGLVRPPGWPA